MQEKLFANPKIARRNVFVRRFALRARTGSGSDWNLSHRFPEIGWTVVEPHKGDRRYVRRNKKGFKDVVDVGRSLAADRKRTAKTKVKKGQGDRGDVKR